MACGREWPQSSGGTSRAVVPLPGLIYILQTNGVLAAARADGQITRTFPQMGRFEQAPPAASPDGRYLALPTGQILRVGSGDLTRSTTDVSRFMAPYSFVAPVGAFADHDRYVAIRGDNRYAGFKPDSPVSLAPLGAGPLIPLGSADKAAGDPQAAGAFVTVASTGPIASATPVLSTPDLRVELRDAGRAAVVLATTGQLLADVGAPADQPSLLSVYPSPQGDSVAVVVAPDSRSSSDAGLVVLDRHGHVQGTVAAGIGPSSFSVPAWAPDGRSLAYATAGDRCPELSIWSPGGSTTTSALPNSASSAYACLWAADGGGVLFSAIGGPPGAAGSSPATWTVVLRHGAVIPSTGAGYPLLWSASQP